MTPSPGIEPGPRSWEASALTALGSTLTVGRGGGQYDRRLTVTCPKKPTIMSDRSISRRQISMVAALDDISEVIPHLISTGTNSYPAFLHIDDSCGQYFLVSSSLSSSSPPKGELKNTRAVLRCCFKLAFETELR